MGRQCLIGPASPLVLAVWLTAILWPSLSRAEDAQTGAITDKLIGTWMLVSVITYVGSNEIVPGVNGPVGKITDIRRPYGSNPQGRLIFERSGHFESTVANSDGSRPASNDPDAPVELEASSGKYHSYNPYHPKAITFETETSSPDEFYIEVTTLTANALEFDTVGPPGTVTYSSCVYRRAE